MINDQLTEDIELVLQFLSRADAQTIKLRYQGNSDEEIAEVLGKKPGTIKTRRFRAQELCRRLKPEVETIRALARAWTRNEYEPCPVFRLLDGLAAQANVSLDRLLTTLLLAGRKIKPTNARACGALLRVIGANESRINELLLTTEFSHTGARGGIIKSAPVRRNRRQRERLDVIVDSAAESTQICLSWFDEV